MNIYKLMKISFNRIMVLLFIFLVSCNGEPNYSDTVVYEFSDQLYPVTINSCLGSTKITEKPKRIITLGAGAEDISYLLNCTPVATASFPWAGDEDGRLPWFKETLNNQKQAIPATVTMMPFLDIIEILSLRPDVVLAPRYGMIKTDYENLSKFTKVISYPNKFAYHTTIKQQIEIIAALCGDPQKGKGLIKNIDDFFSSIRNKYPQYGEYTFAYINANDRKSKIEIYPPGDTRVDTLISMGFKLPKNLKQKFNNNNNAVIKTSFENIDILYDADIIIAWYSNPNLQNSVEKNKMFNTIPAIKKGNYLAKNDPSFVLATFFATPLSLEWTMEKYLQEINKIIKDKNGQPIHE